MKSLRYPRYIFGILSDTNLLTLLYIIAYIILLHTRIWYEYYKSLSKEYVSAARAAHIELHNTKPNFIVILVSSNDLWQIWQLKHSGVACQWAIVFSFPWVCASARPELVLDVTIDDFNGKDRRCSSGAMYSPQVRHT